MKMHGNKKGLTLMEVVVAMGLFSLLMSSVVWIFITSLRNSSIIWDQLESQQEGRLVLQHIVDDVRRSEISSNGSYPLVSATENELIFYANIDEDSLRERVRFWLEDGNIQKGVIKPAGQPLSYDGQIETVRTLTHYVVNEAEGTPLFTYYDTSYAGTQEALSFPVDMTSIRVVHVQLKIEKNINTSPVPLHLESLVHIRSLKNN